MFRTVLQSAADLLISMLAGGKHTEIKEDAGPYNGANDNLKQLDKPEFYSQFLIRSSGVMAVKVYIAPVLDAPVRPVWPEARQAQLDATKNDAHRKARYQVWRLLEFALRDGFGLELPQLQLTLKDGKWSCPQCFFSLSHSHRAVAVAVSQQPVGIDIEPVRPLRRELETKLLGDGELAECRLLSDEAAGAYLLRKWCEKESVFKLGNEALYRPRTVIPGELTRVVTAQLPDGAYCLAVASRSPEAMMLKSHWELAQLREIYGGEMPNPGNL